MGFFIKMTNKQIDLVGTVLLYLTIVGTLKVTGSVTWAWWAILAPIWGTAALVAVLLFFSGWMIALKGKGDWS